MKSWNLEDLNIELKDAVIKIILAYILFVVDLPTFHQVSFSSLTFFDGSPIATRTLLGDIKVAIEALKNLKSARPTGCFLLCVGVEAQTYIIYTSTDQYYKAQWYIEKHRCSSVALVFFFAQLLIQAPTPQCQTTWKNKHRRCLAGLTVSSMKPPDKKKHLENIKHQPP